MIASRYPIMEAKVETIWFLSGILAQDSSTKISSFYIKARTTTVDRAGKVWSMPRFWVSIHSYKKQTVKKIALPGSNLPWRPCSRVDNSNAKLPSSRARQRKMLLLWCTSEKLYVEPFHKSHRPIAFAIPSWAAACCSKKAALLRHYGGGGSGAAKSTFSYG